MKKLFENVGGNEFKLSDSNNLNEISDSEADPSAEFERWIKKAQPGIERNDITYDLMEQAFEAGFEEGVSWGRSYGADDVRRGYGPTGLRGDPQ